MILIRSWSRICKLYVPMYLGMNMMMLGSSEPKPSQKVEPGCDEPHSLDLFNNRQGLCIIVGSLVGGLLLYFLPVRKKGVADDY